MISAMISLIGIISACTDPAPPAPATVYQEVTRSTAGCRRYWSGACMPEDDCRPREAAVECPEALTKPGDQIRFYTDGRCVLTPGCEPGAACVAVDTDAACPTLVKLPPPPPPVAAEVRYTVTRGPEGCEGRLKYGTPDRLGCPPGLNAGDTLWMMTDGTCRATPRCAPGSTCPERVTVPCPAAESMPFLPG
jgi:hypothetical protein